MTVAAVSADEGICLLRQRRIAAAQRFSRRILLADGRDRLRHRRGGLHFTIGKEGIDRAAIVVRKNAQSLGYTPHHRIADRRARELLAFLNQAPGENVGRGKTGHLRLADVGRDRAAQILFALIGALQVEPIGCGARCVAIAAAADILDQIAAALGLRLLARLVGRHREVAALPERDRRLATERKSNLILFRHCIRLGQRLDIGFDVERILRLHAAIGGVGHNRIEVVALPIETDQNRIQKLRIGPAADAIGVRRNVRPIEGADRRLHLHAAGEQFGVVAGAVAGAAACGVEHVFAVVDIGLVGGEGILSEGIARRGTRGTERDCDQRRE